MSRSILPLLVFLALGVLTGCGHLTEIYVLVPEELEGLRAHRVDTLDRIASREGGTGGSARSSDDGNPGGSAGGAESAAAERYVAQLGGNDPVHPVQTDATGRAVFTVRESSSGSEIDFRLEVENIEQVLMAHIHVAPRGDFGPVVAWLYPTDPPSSLVADPFSIGSHPDAAQDMLVEGPFSGVLSQGTLTQDDLVGQLDGQSVEALADHLSSGDAVVNIHTRQNVMGEVWGDIRFTR